MRHPANLFYEFGPFRLDATERLLLREGEAVPLTPKIFDLLLVLVQHSGRILGKDELMRAVWPDSFVEEANLTRNVSTLRKALGESPNENRYIETIPWRGYRFAAGVRECWDESAELLVQERTRSMISIEQEEEREGENAEGVIETTEEPQRRGTTFGRTEARTGTAWISKSLKLVCLAAGALLVAGAVFYRVLELSDSERRPLDAIVPTHKQITFTGKAAHPAISPDGKYIAYVSFQSEVGKKVMVQDLAGGQPLEVFGAQECGDLRWSPDGSELMLGAWDSGRAGIFLVPRLGGTSRLVKGGQSPACWSPDGSQVAVAGHGRANTILFVNKLTGKQTSISLNGSFRWIWDIHWSAARNLLLFVTQDDQARFAIWTIRPDGSQQRKVVEEGPQILSARWSPQGDAIYYFYLRPNEQTTDLWKIPVTSNTGKPKATASAVLTGLQAGGYYARYGDASGAFALSGDGKRLVYTRDPWHSNLWRATVKGSGKKQKIEAKQLTTGTSQIERPSVSPDGQWVAFSMGYYPTANLYSIPIAGGSPKQMTFLNSYNVGAVWSRDGKQLAFASTQDGSPGVWIVNADGGMPRQFSRHETSDTFYLTWSPGSEILYQRTGNGARNFHLLNPKTGEERPLVRNDAVGWMFEPVYSPDGKKIAVAWNRPRSPGIWVISLSDSSELLVYQSFPLISPIGWSTDGKWIYALREKKIVRIPLTGGDARTVVSLPFESIGGVGMTPDGKQFVCMVYESQPDVWMVENFDPAMESQPAR